MSDSPIGSPNHASDLERNVQGVRPRERMFSQMVEHAPIGIYVIDAAFRIQQVNQFAATVFRTVVPLLGRDFAEVVTELWGPDVGASVAQIFRRTLESGEKYVSSAFIELRHDIRIQQAYEWEVQRITLDDGTHGVACYFQDITMRVNTERSLRESEERFHALADNIPQLAWIADAGTDGQVHWFNRNWYEYTGTTLEQMQGLGWHSVHHPEHSHRVIEKFAYHVQQGLDWEDTFPLRGQDGAFRWFLSRMKCIRDTNGKVVQIFGTNTDITVERQMAEELTTLTSQLSEADRRKDEFLATLAHELRNPLAPICNAIQVMKLSDTLDEGVSELIEVMERQAFHLIRLVDDLLDISRISRGKIELRLERVALSMVLQSAIEISRPSIDAASHDLRVTNDSVGIELVADSVRLSQVIANLLINSSKYMDAGGAIDLEVRCQGGDVVISVTDIGLGIPPESLDRVFDMFVQIDHNRPHTHGGLGIGLALSKSLVEMHGGRILAFSEGHGKGSRFEVILPALVREIEEDAIDAEDGTDGLIPCRKILVVDDMRMARLTLERLLSTMGQKVRSVDSGQAAFEAAIKEPPDIIISDIGMPVMDGYELARRIRSNPELKQVILVALTGYGQLQDQELAKAAGFDCHLTKPAKFEDLRNLLVRYGI